MDNRAQKKLDYKLRKHEEKRESSRAIIKQCEAELKAIEEVQVKKPTPEEPP